MTLSIFKAFLNTVCVFILMCITSSVNAEHKLVFATHAKAPLSNYLSDVIQEVLRPYAISSEVIEMPGNRVIYQVNNGYIDGDLSRVINFKSIADLETTNYLLVNEPIVLAEVVIVSPANKIIPTPLTWQRINQSSIAFVRGSKTIEKYLTKNSQVAVSTALQALDMVASKRADAAIMFKSIANNLLNQHPKLKEKLTIQSPPLMSFHLFPYLHKKHANLVPKIEYSLKQLKESGELARLANKHKILPIIDSNKLESDDLTGFIKDKY